MVPKRASAVHTASWNVTPFSAAAESKTRLSAKRTRSGGTARRSATASVRRDLARSAACNAAGVGAEIDGAEIGIAGVQANIEGVEAENFGDDGGEDIVGALADFGGAAK